MHAIDCGSHRNCADVAAAAAAAAVAATVAAAAVWLPCVNTSSGSRAAEDARAVKEAGSRSSRTGTELLRV